MVALASLPVEEEATDPIRVKSHRLDSPWHRGISPPLKLQHYFGRMLRNDARILSPGNNQSSQIAAVFETSITSIRSTIEHWWLAATHAVQKLAATPATIRLVEIIKSVQYRIKAYWRLYSMGHTSKVGRKTLNNLQATYSVVTFLVVCGIIFNIYSFSWLFHDGWGKFIAVMANATIGLSLIIQYQVIAMAILASSQTKAHSDETVALANERASLAEARAAEATLELLKLKVARSLTSQQVEEVSRKIQGHAGTPYVLSVCSDPEAICLLQQVDSALRTGGWSPQHPKTGHITGLRLPGKPTIRSATVKGSWILIPAVNETKWREAATTLAKTLNDVGFPIEAVAVDVSTAEQHALNIVIGKKL